MYEAYRHLAIERADPAPTPEELDAIEEALCATLPASFVEFLRFANGVCLEAYVVHVTDERGAVDAVGPIAFFSASRTAGFGTFVGEIHAAREHVAIPPGVLPFGRAGSSSMVYLDLSPGGEGRVVAHLESYPAWTGLRERSAFVDLAPSFDEFLARLHVDREALLEDLTGQGLALHHIEATEEFLNIGLPGWRNDEQLMEAVAQALARVTT